MLNKQGLFGQNERYRRDPRGLEPSAPAPAPEPQRVEPPRQEAVEVPKPKVEEPKGSRLIVGPDIKLKGAEITDCDTLVVEGRVEASMDARVIQIAEGGSFHGTVGVDIAEIRGRFDGEMTARKALIIHPERPGRGEDPLRQDRHRGRRRADRRCRHDRQREARVGPSPRQSPRSRPRATSPLPTSYRHRPLSRGAASAGEPSSQGR